MLASSQAWKGIEEFSWVCQFISMPQKAVSIKYTITDSQVPPYVAGLINGVAHFFLAPKYSLDKRAGQIYLSPPVVVARTSKKWTKFAYSTPSQESFNGFHEQRPNVIDFKNSPVSMKGSISGQFFSKLSSQ